MKYPHDDMIEQSFLGALIIDPEQMASVIDKVKPEYFYDSDYSQIYIIIKNMYLDDQVIDLPSLTINIQKSNKNIDILKVAGLLSMTSVINLDYYTKVLTELYIRRQVIAQCIQIMSMSENVSVPIDNMTARISGLMDVVINEITGDTIIKTFGENINEFLVELKERQKKEHNEELLKPSTRYLRELIPEYAPGQLIVIAGRSSMGKSAFTINEAMNIGKNNNVLFFALEMSTKEIVQRILGSELDYDYHLIKDNKPLSSTDWNKIDYHANQIYKYGILLDDTPLASFEHIKSISKIQKEKNNIKAVFIDTIQLMSADKSLPREQQVSTITRHLKAMAKELKLPIFAVAQLNRNPDNRPGEGFRPRLSDLRESGAIEQDADIVLFPFRPEYYYKDNPDFKGKGEIIVAKNRNGATGSAMIRYNMTITKFYDDENANEGQPF